MTHLRGLRAYCVSTGFDPIGGRSVVLVVPTFQKLLEVICNLTGPQSPLLGDICTPSPIPYPPLEREKFKIRNLG